MKTKILLFILTNFLLWSIFVYSSSDYSHVENLANKKIIQKQDDINQYRLQDSISRREMLKIMMNISEENISENCEWVFQDLTADDWGCKYAESAANIWYITKNTYFRPDDNVTQIEALKMIMNARTIEKEENTDWRLWYSEVAKKIWLLENTYFDFDEIILREWVFRIASLSIEHNSYTEDVNIEEPDLQQYNQSSKKDILYASENPLQSLDIYYPENSLDTFPVLIWIHWGGWAIGDKSNKIDDKISFAQKNNFIFVSINYRLSPFPTRVSDDGRIMHPTHISDIELALDWVNDNIPNYSWDPDNITIMWHSAGAHLSSLISLHPNYYTHKENISCVVSLDTEAYNINEQVLSWNQNKLFENAFGLEEKIHKDASPLTQVGSIEHKASFFIVKRYPNSLVNSPDSFISALRKEWHIVEDVDASEYSHSEVNNSIGSDNLITPKLEVFISKYCLR